MKPLKNKHSFDIVHIRLLNQSMVAESAFLLRFLLGQDMIFISMLVLNFSGACNFKSLLGTGLRF
jgi:hypothetical protein